MRRNLVAAALALGLIVAGCSSGTPAASGTPEASDTPAASGTPGAPTPSPPAAASFTETTDVVYMTVNGVDLLMDVYTPIGSGPWPVVVAFHAIDSNGKDEIETTTVAEAAAAEGMMVFAPSWIVWDPGPFPLTIEIFKAWKGAANCAVALAQQTAADYGGDADSTIIYGFSAGAGAALLAALEPAEDPIPGCRTDASPASVSGVVLGDGDYFMHTENFDTAFQADLEGMQAELVSLTDPAHWPPGLKSKFFLWVAASGTQSRAFGNPLDESGWLAQRDLDGSMRMDLERLGQLEDGVMSFVDSGQLLALRLSEAGIEVTLDEYPGGHTTSNKVPELIGYLKAAAAYQP